MIEPRRLTITGEYEVEESKKGKTAYLECCAKRDVAVVDVHAEADAPK
jgi:hypothetical protein